MTGVTPTNNTNGPTPQSGSSAKLAADFDMFLKLLTTQLQYQDPLDPMDSSEYTQQLVSYSQVEQAIKQTEKLDSVLDRLDLQGLTAATGYIGREVTVYQPTVALTEDGANWFYELGDEAAETTIKIYNSRGVLVHELDGTKTEGSHDFSWDGKDASGDKLPEGFYTMKVEAKTHDGEDVPTAVGTKGIVETVEAQDGEIILTFNGTPVRAANIAAVRAPRTTQ